MNMAGKKAKIRLWCETPLAAGREVMLNDKQSHYLTNVMKLAVGDAVLAFDNEHGEFLCTLKTAGKKSCRLGKMSGCLAAVCAGKKRSDRFHHSEGDRTRRGKNYAGHYRTHHCGQS